MWFRLSRPDRPPPPIPAPSAASTHSRNSSASDLKLFEAGLIKIINFVIIFICYWWKSCIPFKLGRFFFFTVKLFCTYELQCNTFICLLAMGLSKLRDIYVLKSGWENEKEGKKSVNCGKRGEKNIFLYFSFNSIRCSYFPPISTNFGYIYIEIL